MSATDNRGMLFQAGFTLIEVMIALVILAVLTALALPAFSQFMLSNRLTASANMLVADFSLARIEAARRGMSVRVCRAASSTSCESSGTDWSSGYILWSDTNGDDSLQASEIIKYAEPLPSGVTLTASTGAVVTFLPYGVISGGSAWTFSMCIAGAASGRELGLPATGRPSVKKTGACT